MDPTTLARAQGAYYLVTGLWPLVSMRSFELVTGPKRDDWLVRTVGLLALAGGAVLVRGSHSVNRVREPGIATALAFAAASGWYGGRGRIRRIYLADAAAEVAFVVAWLAVRRDARYSARRPGTEER
jgi:hypothetical protein